MSSNNKKLINNTSNTNNTNKNTLVSKMTEETQNSSIIEVKNEDGLKYLSTIDKNSIDLILTDPPYIISRDTGMNTHYNTVKMMESKNIQYVKSEKEWEEYKNEKNINNDDKKENYMKYGTIYGKKYCVKNRLW